MESPVVYQRHQRRQLDVIWLSQEGTSLLLRTDWFTLYFVPQIVPFLLIVQRTLSCFSLAWFLPLELQLHHHTLKLYLIKWLMNALLNSAQANWLHWWNWAERWWLIHQHKYGSDRVKIIVQPSSCLRVRSRVKTTMRFQGSSQGKFAKLDNSTSNSYLSMPHST